jgi:predicted O-methyltransferase YrrM
LVMSWTTLVRTQAKLADPIDRPRSNSAYTVRLAMYSVPGYGRMIADRLRMDAYAQALRQAIKPTSAVLDIGTGTGVFALLACQMGARKVYAIEPDDSIQLARQIAADNGLADRIEFIQDKSLRTTLPERADIIVSDLRGVLPWFQQNILSIIDARERLLAPEGVLIPRCDILWAGVVEAPDIYTDYTTPWLKNDYDLDMQPARAIVTNTWRKCRVKPDQLLTEPQCLAKLDYRDIKSSDLKEQIKLTAERSGTAHGLCVWFDAILDDGIGFSNAPGAPELIYGSGFFPFADPVMLVTGDTVSVAVQANLVGEDYIWSWNTCVRGDSSELKAEFKQSTFFGVPLSAANLRKQAAKYIPALDQEGQIDRFILTSMDGRTSLNDIANAVSARYSSHFASWQDALTRVGELSKRYSQ